MAALHDDHLAAKPGAIPPPTRWSVPRQCRIPAVRSPRQLVASKSIRTSAAATSCGWPRSVWPARPPSRSPRPPMRRPRSTCGPSARPATAKRSTAGHQQGDRRRGRRGRRHSALPCRQLRLLLHPPEEQHRALPGARAQPSWRPTPHEAPRGYDAAEPQGRGSTYQDYGHNHWHNSLIWGEDLDDIAIIGPGLIWGKGLSRGMARQGLTSPTPATPAWATNPSRSRTATTSCCATSRFCKAGHFGILATGVDNLTIDNLKIDTNRDGMDIDCCRNVRISNCTVNSPVGRRHLPEKLLRAGLCARHREIDHRQLLRHRRISSWHVAGRHVASGRAAEPARRHRPHQVRHGIERRIQEHHHLQLRLRELPGLGAGDRGRRDGGGHHRHRHHHARHPQRARSSCAWARGCAGRPGPVGTIRRVIISNVRATVPTPTPCLAHHQRHSRPPDRGHQHPRPRI